MIILLLNNSRASPVLNVTGLLRSAGRGGDPALKNNGAGISHTTFTYFDHHPFHSRILGPCSDVMAPMVGKHSIHRPCPIWNVRDQRTSGKNHHFCI